MPSELNWFARFINTFLLPVLQNWAPAWKASGVLFLPKVLAIIFLIFSQPSFAFSYASVTLSLSMCNIVTEDVTWAAALLPFNGHTWEESVCLILGAQAVFIVGSKGRKHIHLKTDCDYECNLEKTMNEMRRFSVTSHEKFLKFLFHVSL